jgi:hypothetical protein
MIESDRVLAETRKSRIDDPLFGRVVVRVDERATRTMDVFKVKMPRQSRGRDDIYDLVETIPSQAAFRPVERGGARLRNDARAGVARHHSLIGEMPIWLSRRGQRPSHEALHGACGFCSYSLVRRHRRSTARSQPARHGSAAC